jgi:hypothetical protein
MSRLHKLKGVTWTHHKAAKSCSGGLLLRDKRLRRAPNFIEKSKFVTFCQTTISKKGYENLYNILIEIQDMENNINIT